MEGFGFTAALDTADGGVHGEEGRGGDTADGGVQCMGEEGRGRGYS